MANKKEIETKLCVPDITMIFRLKRELMSKGMQPISTYQHDVYYVPKTENYMEEKYPYKWLRLRYLSGGSSELCYKHFYPEGAEKHIYCDEYQSTVQDPEAIAIILAETGFQIIVEVDKKRETYNYERYLLSIDYVKNLGNFIEIEVSNVIFEPDKEKEILNATIEKLGLAECTEDLRGYPYMLYDCIKKQKKK